MLTNSLTPSHTVLLEKLTVLQLLEIFCKFCRNPRFITIARHLTLSSAKRDQSMPSQLVSLRPILIFTYLRLGLPSCLFPSDFPQKKNCNHFSSLRATCPLNSVLDLITLIIFDYEYMSWCSSLMKSSPASMTFYLTNANIFLGTSVCLNKPRSSIICIHRTMDAILAVTTIITVSGESEKWSFHHPLSLEQALIIGFSSHCTTKSSDAGSKNSFVTWVTSYNILYTSSPQQHQYSNIMYAIGYTVATCFDRKGHYQANKEHFI